jgi:hypothetical protein
MSVPFPAVLVAVSPAARALMMVLLVSVIALRLASTLLALTLVGGGIAFVRDRKSALIHTRMAVKVRVDEGLDLHRVEVSVTLLDHLMCPTARDVFEVIL